MSETVGEIETRLRAEHRSVLETALSRADRVAAGWEGGSTTDRDAVVGPYERSLRGGNVLEALLAAFVGSAVAAGEEPAGRPVAAPPYAVVTAEGVVLRLTVDDGRLVFRLRAFERDPYRRGPPLAAALSVERRGANSSEG